MFSIEEQKHIFQKGKDLFLQSELQEAENVFSLLMESASQHRDYSLYIKALIWRNRVYINTSKFTELNLSLSLSQAYLEYLNDPELLYYYRFHTIICNQYFSIGNSTQEYEDLFEELSRSDYKELTFLVGSNYLLHLIESDENEKSLQIHEEIENFLKSYTVPRKLSLSIHYIYVFLAHYKNNDLKMCKIILNQLQHQPVLIENPNYAYIFYICQALYIGATGNMNLAKQMIDEQINKLNQLVTIHFELKLWIDLLHKSQLFEEVIYYQRLLIQSLETLYSNEMSTLRQKSIEDKTKHYYESQIYIDQLTGVKNRNYYENLLTKQAQYKNYTVAVLDIDKFKSINDTYGHSTGDEAIKWIATHLIENSPKHDISIVRYGGDEFILLIPYSYEFIKEHLQHLHSLIISTPFPLKKESITIPLSISMGIAYTEKTYKTIDELFELADAAIYEAKENRGTIVVKSIEN